MPVMDTSNLRELVDAADLALRVASELRLYRQGHPLRDRSTLNRAAQFLEQARIGGDLLVGGPQPHGIDRFRGALDPLNWSADVYFETHPDAAGSDTGAYRNIADFLQKLENLLRTLPDKPVDDGHDIELAAAFFGKLGQGLGSRADRLMRHPSTAY